MTVRVKDFDIIEAITLSESATFFSTNVQEFGLGYAIDVTFSAGNAVGAFKLQVSLDGSGWADYPSSSQSVDLATSTYIIWEMTRFTHKFVRVIYTKSSGTTGSAQISFHGIYSSP